MPVTRTRLSPAARREQLLDLGAAMVAAGRLEELSIDGIAEEAGISRGLLYHYFPSKRDFRRAVLRRIADELIVVTAPPPDLEPLDQLVAGLAAYVDFVRDNRVAYVAFVRGAAGGDEDLREIQDEARAALTDRIFTTADPGDLEALGLVDTPAMRLLVRGWSAGVEEMLLTWLDEPAGIDRQELLDLMVRALSGLGTVAGDVSGSVVRPTR